jgi:hypothetical protein
MVSRLHHDNGDTTLIRCNRYHRAAKYAWRSGTLHATVHWVSMMLAQEKLCVGTDHPSYTRAQEMLAQIKTAAKDQDAFDSAKRAHPSEDADDFQNLAEATDKYDNAAPVRQKNMKQPEKDWRLQNLAKALWWAEVDRAWEIHDHPDKEHVAVVRKGRDVYFLRERIEDSGGDASVNPYQEIALWLEGNSG